MELTVISSSLKSVKTLEISKQVALYLLRTDVFYKRKGIAKYKSCKSDHFDSIIMYFCRNLPPQTCLLMVYITKDS